MGATVDRITADINAAKEGMRVNGDVQKRNEGNISSLEMQVGQAAMLWNSTSVCQSVLLNSRGIVQRMLTLHTFFICR